MPRKNARTRGVTPARARRLLLALPEIEEEPSYGMPSFKVKGRFFARFRDDDTVLVVMVGTITDRDILTQLDSRAFFFTDHYRNYPTVLIRLAEVPVDLLKDVLQEAHAQAEVKRARRKRPG